MQARVYLPAKVNDAMKIHSVDLRKVEGHDLPRHDRVVCVGTFDGVHIGHQHLIKEAKLVAEASGMSLCILTFRNHPMKLLSPSDAPKLLTTLNEKLHLLSQLGADECLVVEFDSDLAAMSAFEFCELLYEALHAKVLVMGEGSSIGYGREGTAERLRKLSDVGKLKLSVVVVGRVCFGRDAISSSRIRSELMKGHVRLAQMMLGRPYSLTGIAVSGMALGRQLGFPTINLQLDEDKLLPRFGVYAGTAKVASECEASCASQHRMVANIGVRPTIDGERISVEAHIVDEEIEVRHGCDVTLRLLYFLRPEMKFGSLQELARRVAHDVERAKKLLQHAFSGCHELQRGDGLSEAKLKAVGQV